MKYNTVAIKTTVPTTIFELPEIKLRVNALFDEMEGDIKARFDEIRRFISNGNLYLPGYDSISYKEVTKRFKTNFYQQVSKEAVEIAFTQECKHDIVGNIIELISKNSMKKAILGEPMVYAFEDIMREVSKSDGVSSCLNKGLISLIEQEFLGENTI